MDDCWRLSRPPFAPPGDPTDFVALVAAEEALARMEWLVRRNGQVGLVYGPEGTGKTTILRQFAHLHRQACDCVHVSGATLTSATLPAHVLPGNVARGTVRAPKSETESLWTDLGRLLTARRLVGRPLVILFDDAHLMTESAASDLRRLVAVAEIQHEPLTVFLSVRQASDRARLADPLSLTDPLPRPAVLDQWHDRIDLRIDVPAWEADTTEHYLDAVWNAAGGWSDHPFDGAAVLRLNELAGGSGRQTRRLADLALVAATSQRLRRIESDLIEQVYDELVAAHTPMRAY